MKHVMIDIETMSSQVDAAVISIGLVEFEPHTGRVTDKRKEFRCTFAAMREAGRHFDPETVEWWMRQSSEAQAQLLKAPRYSDAKRMMEDVGQWLDEVTTNPWKLALWAKGPTFDLAILRNLSEQLGVMWRGHYSREYCVRTMLLIAKANGWSEILDMKPHVAHGALSDATHQAKQVMNVMARLRA